MVHRDIARSRGDADNLYILASEEKDQSQCVIDSGINVGKNGNHGRQPTVS
ncbi:Uncharacterised protein [Mycobacteroides abscessus subsp. massiliense]|nr:Uncharacterised protein [Mycobacteroides abscessus subsp. massiliense]